MKKIKIFTMLTVLLISSLGLFSIEKADAASSGWQTYGGITAKVSTNKDNYKYNDQILIDAEKTSTGGKVYYEVYVDKLQTNGMWVEVGRFGKGSTSGKISQVSVKAIYGTGPYKVRFKLFSDSAYDKWIGDWFVNFNITP
ncbi:hypothetical protein VO178_19405 [Lysinibacillus fusiformis]|uniref:hypothetical protein n=1 Tax=Lysinibacillus fusiformis TaxID=28031 RepID=UPI002D791FCD|nr:hypothetical protein [Lysinibacillus fusiformis]WRS97522.1 hypothetical protein VO178_19405 [Lysinibacillus fusiformis]